MRCSYSARRRLNMAGLRNKTELVLALLYAGDPTASSQVPNVGTDAFQLTAEGRKKAEEIWSRLSSDERQKFIGLKRRFNKISLKQLLRYVYKKYPEYTEASEIKEYLNLQ